MAKLVHRGKLWGGGSPAEWHLGKGEGWLGRPQPCGFSPPLPTSGWTPPPRNLRCIC